MGPRSSSQYLRESAVESDPLPHILLFPRLKILNSQTVPLVDVHGQNVLTLVIKFSQLNILGVGWDAVP
jgi:hypothetical protein